MGRRGCAGSPHGFPPTDRQSGLAAPQLDVEPFSSAATGLIVRGTVHTVASV
jgi:hypothetical protein